MKKRLTQAEEFEIMKLVLDKFLWIGLVIMLFGLWKLTNSPFLEGFSWIIIGAIILTLFLVMIVKEFEIIR